ncbi:helix-hairpin-helix domain-containing protein [Liquorilactobacillus satsumensis]|uniref:helix-hairpin-helix domain-containing protein n=1 Tax=Liquorilactobacillus satsumensis TaxID=259059 RepID=UPI001E31554F|nr:helix-hairpin-helix domain-containing protein [Liquorilactobacillus satsumensis]MCC7665553.1 competence protein ComE [Liquorilactobacillus satsumensis]MCP9357311.1 helix-hairpin-helix domain-containing protein [Liquorilactobacillus satsumensis]MCP9371935.1 helix-hairpin-helix domain-containing protein [Liquorilactobacillus satsumensis]
MLEQLRDFWEEHRSLLVVSFILISGGFLIGSNLYNNSRKSTTSQFGVAKSSMSASTRSKAVQSTAATSHSALVSVDVKGAVKNPGVYHAQEGARVNEIITAAGGFAATADQNQVNLALKIKDQQIIYVPFRGEIASKPVTTVTANISEQAGSAAGTVTEGTKIDLNQAKKEDLLKIPGIGDKKAEQILAYRTEHGNFNQLDELKNISGIGDKILVKLKSYLKIGS